MRKLFTNLPHYKYRSYQQHEKAVDLQKVLPEQIFGSFQKFAFVRNPWDWQVSLYHYILKSPGHKNHGKVCSLGSFPDFVRWHLETDKLTQMEFLCNSQGELLVDFIGRYEAIDEDFSQCVGRSELGRRYLI